MGKQDAKPPAPTALPGDAAGRPDAGPRIDEVPHKAMGAVQLVMHRKLRNIQKRIAKIEHAEKKVLDGGAIDAQQEELIAGKANTLAQLEEFTKLAEQCAEAVEEDCKAAIAAHVEAAAAKEKAKAEKMAARAEKDAKRPKDTAASETAPGPKGKAKKADDSVASAAHGSVSAPAPAPEGGGGGRRDKKGGARNANAAASAAAAAAAAAGAAEETVRRIISLLYFSQVFDTNLPDRPPFSHALEREAALSYLQDPSRPVTHPDLDFLCTLGTAITTRPMTPNGLMSHHEAIEQCVAHAVKWAASYESRSADVPEDIVPATPGVPFRHVRDVIDRIVGSPYNTLKPVMVGGPAPGPPPPGGPSGGSVEGSAGVASSGTTPPPVAAAPAEPASSVAVGGRPKRERKERKPRKEQGKDAEAADAEVAAAVPAPLRQQQDPHQQQPTGMRAGPISAPPGQWGPHASIPSNPPPGLQAFVGSAPGGPAPVMPVAGVGFSGMGGMGFLNMVQQRQQQQQQQQPPPHEQQPPPEQQPPYGGGFGGDFGGGFGGGGGVEAPPPTLPALVTVSSMDQFGFVVSSDGGDGATAEDIMDDVSGDAASGKHARSSGGRGGGRRGGGGRGGGERKDGGRQAGGDRDGRPPRVEGSGKGGEGAHRPGGKRGEGGGRGGAR